MFVLPGLGSGGPKSRSVSLASGNGGQSLVGLTDGAVGPGEVGIVLAHEILDEDHKLLGVGPDLFLKVGQALDVIIPLVLVVYVVVALGVPL